MALLIYSWPQQLSDCWWKPLEQIGFTVQRLNRGGIVKYLNAKVRVRVGTDGSAAILGWSLPWSKRRKLGYVVERTLLASGVQAFFKPRSTNLIYRVNEEPTGEWLERVMPEGTEIHHQSDAANGSANERYHCGLIKSGAESIRFWTGPAINPKSKALAYYLALDADASSVGSDPLLHSFDTALTVNGVTRLETQRKLDR
jgi:hypothetical protein